MIVSVQKQPKADGAPVDSGLSDTVWGAIFNGAVLDSEEFYFLHRTTRFEPSTAGRTELELRYIHGHRWCDPAAIAEIEASGQRVYPLQLAELLADAHRLAARPPATFPRPRAIR